jgi:type III secretion protein W
MDPSSDEAISIEAVNLMQYLLDLLDQKWLTSTRILQLADRHQIDDHQARIILLTGLKTLGRAIPLRVFPDLESRERLLDAMQEALDAAIDAEDEQD